MSSFFFGEKVDKHLIHYVDDGLSVIPTQAFNRVGLIAVGEDGRDQGDTLGCDEGSIDQALPRWDTAGGGKPVRLRCGC